LEPRGILQGPKRRGTYAHRYLSYVEPKSVYIGLTSKNKPRYYQYVPIKESLSAMLQDQSVYKQCCTQHVSTPGIIADFQDGCLYNNSTTSSEVERCLSLILYQDSFEIANPLGSAKKKHKVLGVYYTLGNLHQHNRSKIDHTQLVMLVVEKDLGSVGLRVFKPLVDDLKDLEGKGIDICNQNWRVRLSAIAGDNLGSHWIGGFNTNFANAQYPCRYCTVTKDEIKSGVTSACALLRTPDQCNASVNRTNDSEQLSEEGIKQRSIFNNLEHFHVCNPGLPPCVAHDLQEGIIAYDVPLCLRYFVKSKVLTVNQLNKRLETFPFLAHDSKVKPLALSVALERLSGSASQNWCML
jgi:hypothetical protein